jgi:hypothetical protein
LVRGTRPGDAGTVHHQGVLGADDDRIRECVARFPVLSEDGLREFLRLLDELCPLLELLLGAERKPRDEYGRAFIPEEPGVYLFSGADGVPIYVGQTRNLRERIGQHCRPGSPQNHASLAFNIAKKTAAGAEVDIVGFRAEVAAREDFREHFEVAKRRVAEMPIQYVLEDRSDLRTVFEVFATHALGLHEYNDFETH